MKIKNIKIVFLLFLILLLALFLRIVKLGEIPPGVIDDEACFAYDSYLIILTGKDQWSKLFPLQFRGFGDYRLPIIEYVLAPFLKIFGLSNFVVRLPSALVGALTTIIIFYTVKALVNIITSSKKMANIIALLTSFFLAINPWHISMSRILHEMIFALAFILLMLFFLLRSFNNKKSFLWVILLFVLSFYTYYGVRIFLVLFLFIFFIWEKFSWQKILLFKKYFLLLFILLIPAIINFFSGGGQARFRQVNLTNDVGIIDSLNEHRGACRENLPDFFCKVIYNRSATYVYTFSSYYFNHFGFDFLFSPENRTANALLPNNFFYLFMFPLFIIGLFALVFFPRNWLVLSFLLLAPLADSLTGSGHYGRSFLMIFPVIYFASWGTYYLFRFVSRKKNVLALLIFTLTIFILSEFGLFQLNYLNFFPKMHSFYTHWEYQPLFEYLKTIEGNYDQIYISKVNHDARQYIFYLYYFKIPPEKYFTLPKKYLIEENGWVWVQQLGKFNFINQADRIANYPPKSLLIIHPDGVKNLPEYGKPIAVINYLNGDRAFNIYDLDLIKTELAKLEKNEP